MGVRCSAGLGPHRCLPSPPRHRAAVFGVPLELVETAALLLRVAAEAGMEGGGGCVWEVGRVWRWQE